MNLREGIDQGGFDIAKLNQLAIFDLHIGEDIFIQHQYTHRHERINHPHAVFFSGRIVQIIETHLEPSGFAFQIFSRDFLTIQKIGDRHRDRQFLFADSLVVDIVALIFKNELAVFIRELFIFAGITDVFQITDIFDRRLIIRF